jgi:hypothetical protein
LKSRGKPPAVQYYGTSKESIMFTKIMNYSRGPGNNRCISAGLTLLINVLLYAIVDGLFAIDFAVYGGKVLA